MIWPFVPMPDWMPDWLIGVLVIAVCILVCFLMVRGDDASNIGEDASDE